MFHDIAFALALRTRAAMLVGDMTEEDARKRADRLAAFLPPSQDRAAYAESWMDIARG